MPLYTFPRLMLSAMTAAVPTSKAAIPDDSLSSQTLDLTSGREPLRMIIPLVLFFRQLLERILGVHPFDEMQMPW